MRNLKRVLSLSLASVMLLGMMVMGSSAAKGYDDVDETYNVEAIEVLQALDVMSGDADSNGNLLGTFRPDEPVTRGEMARIMAALLDLDYDYYESTPSRFTDVSGNYAWTKKFVDACATNGIIAGRTATTYDPGAYVTPVEASAMMMRALGYFQYASDYAKGFEVATVAQGSRINIYKGVSSSASEAMTRNQVAQLALNTLKADMVEAVDNTLHITTGADAGSINITGGQVTYRVRVTGEDFGKAISQTENNASGEDGRYGYIIQMGEQLYKGELKREVGVYDEFGRPATYWTYKTDVIGTYAQKATVEYTSGVKEGTLYNLLGRNNYNRIKTGDPDANGTPRAALKVTVNGYDYPINPTRVDDFFENGNSNKNADFTGDGVLTQVYVRDDVDDSIYRLEVDIAITNLWVAKVSSEYNTAKNTLNIDVLHDQGVNVGNSNYAYYAPAVTTLSGDQWEGLDQFKEGDYVLFTYSGSNGTGSGGEVQSLTSAQLVSGVVSRYDADKDNVTIGDVKYNYNKSLVKKDRPFTYGLGKNATVVMDGYDNIIWVDDSTGAEDYLYVYGLISNTGFANQGIARVVFPDGTSDQVVVEKLYVRYKNHADPGGTGTKTGGVSDGGNNQDVVFNAAYHKANRYTTVARNDGSGNTVDIYEIMLDTLPASVDTTNGFQELDVKYENSTKDPDQFNGWYSYSVNNGRYTLTQVESDSYVESGVVNGGGTAQKVKGSAVEYLGVAGQYANNNTTFLLVEGNSVTVYNGISNLPDITLDNEPGGNPNQPGYVGAMKVDDGRDSDYAGLVVIVDDNATVEGGNESMLYIIRETDRYSEKAGETIYEYAAVLDGKEITISTKSSTEFTPGQMYSKYMIDSDGYYKSATNGNWAVGGKRTGQWGMITSNMNADNDLLSFSGDSLKINNLYYLVTKDTEITLILQSNKSATGTSTSYWHNKMINEGVHYLINEKISASSLASKDNGFENISLDWYATVTDTNGRVLDKLYVIIYKAEEK